MNVELLRKVQEQILAEPRQFQMQSLFSGDYLDHLGKQFIPNCGTAACIAGWAVSIYLGTNPRDAQERLDCGLLATWEEGCKQLEITEYEADHLFVVAGWPDPFHDQYRAARTNERRAEVAVARIEHFIATRE